MSLLSSIIRYSFNITALLLTLCGSLLGTTAHAVEEPQQTSLEQQRELFLKAEYAAKRGRLNEYQILLQQLNDYPLTPYLELERLQQVGYLANEDRVLSFLKEYQGTPLDWQLRRPWLSYLAQQNEDQRFVRDFRHPGSLTQRCQLIAAERRLGLADEPFKKKVKGIWLHGFSVPSACDTILAEWAKLGARTTELVWQRIGLAADGGNATLIPYLTGLLPNKLQYLGELYHKVRYSPAAISSLARFRGVDTAKETEVATYALRELVWRDEHIALKAFDRLVNKLPFQRQQRQQIAEEFAVALSLKDHPEARVWHQQVPPSAYDNRLLQWRLASYLRDQDYGAIKRFVESLPAAIAGGSQWQYWLARSSEEVGDKLLANRLYRALAKQRSYYGFLAAAKLGLKVNLERQPIEVDPQALDKIRNHPSTQRAKEFIALERWVDARREWNHLLSTLSGDQQLAAALVASEWNWHDQAIWTLAQVGHFDAVNIRFPMAYGRLLSGAAKNAGIDPSWAMAITRRESAFRADAYSGAGARGLMQLLPSTAKRLRGRSVSYQELHQPQLNVELGTLYLGQLKNRFADNQVLATASYNAGYYKVLDWLPEAPVAADEWIEQIPYYETRDYVKAVLAYQQIYYLRQGNQGNLFDGVASMLIQPSYD